MSNRPSQGQTYRIKAVADTTGLSTHVIRKWEERYHLVHPQRGPNGYRLFTEDDMQLLLYLKTQLNNGESIGQLAQAGEEALRHSMQQIPLDLCDIPPGYWFEAREIIRMARSQEVNAISLLLERWIGRLGLEEALTILIFPLLRLIGELWHQGGISLRGEHIVSRIVRQHLINVLREDAPAGGPHAFIACVPGDFHEIGALSASVVLRHRGWHSLYLGPNVSFDMLKMALRRKHAQLMILSCTIEPMKDTLPFWLRDITQHLQPSCTVMVGGAGFAPYTHLLGAHDISYVSYVKDLQSLQPRTRVARLSRVVNQSSSIPFPS